jgi:thiosulfate/3-mercaptopyruvate sulfurtransferase
VTDFPQVVEVAWVAAHLAEPDLLLADVRGPNAHSRGHIRGSIPLVLGAPAPSTDRETVQAFAEEVGLRLRRQGVSGEERLVLYDEGGGVGAASAAVAAEVAGHPRVAVMSGGLAAWEGELETGAVYPEKTRAQFTPRLEAVPSRDELLARLDDPDLVVLDVRRPEEYTGKGGYPCDPRQGHIPRARHLQVDRLYAEPGRPQPPELIRELTGLPEGAEIVTYCHSGSRSALAMHALRAAGYRARNYVGSWHEWSRHPELPIER